MGYALPYSFYSEDEKEQKQYAEWLRIAREDDIIFNLVPEKFMTEEILEEGLRYSGNSLQFLQDWIKTERMCLAAVEDNFRDFEFVPKKLRTEEVFLAAEQAFGREINAYEGIWMGPPNFKGWAKSLV